MPMKLTEAQINRVLKMLEQGFTQRYTAEKCGLAKSTVYRIAIGEISVQKAIQFEEHQRQQSGTVPAYRCKGCGHKVVYDPCRICHHNQAVANRRSIQQADIR